MHFSSGRFIPFYAAALLAMGCAARQTGSSVAVPPPPLAVSAPNPPADSTPHPLTAAGYKALFKLESRAPDVMKTGATGRLKIRVSNAGTEPFPAHTGSASGIGAVFLSYHVFPAGAPGAPENATLWDGDRSAFPADLRPGDSVVLPLNFIAPGKPGRYDLHVDMVHEGVFWFSTKGNPELILPIQVQ